MKLCWFHLMPWTELPEDFRDRHESVWVTVDPDLFDPVRAHALYGEFMDQLEHAAEVGFDGICVNEHHASAYGMMPSPNLIASALARRTRDAALLVMGNSIALYDPPTRVAEELAMLDCISGGRLVAGFPVGTPQDTCFAYGRNPATLRARYAEAHDLILRAWTAREVFPWSGRFFQQRYVNVWPRPLQQPHPPIWIPGGGSIETGRFCAERGYVYAYLSYFGYRAARQVMEGFWREAAGLGLDRNPHRAAFLQFVGVAESRAEALRLYREPAEYFYGRSLALSPRFASPPGYVSEATLRARVRSQMQRAALSEGFELHTRFEEIADAGYILIGSPDEVAEQLRRVARELNTAHLLLLLQFGNMGTELARYNTDLFATRVAPQLRGLFADEWEPLGWPQPLPRAERARPRPLPEGLSAAGSAERP